MADGSEVSDNTTGSVAVEDAKPKKNKPVCRFYSKSGYCKFEEECRFLHPKNPAEMKKSSEDSEKVDDEHATLGDKSRQTCANENDSRNKKKKCRFFSTKAGCARGDGCKFAHVTKQVGTTTSATTATITTTTARATKSVMTSRTDTTLTTAVSKTSVTPNATEAARSTSTMQTTSSTTIATPKLTTASTAKNSTTDVNMSTKVTSSSGPNKAVSNNKKYQRVIPTTEKLSSLDEDELTKLRTREIDQLIRRFGKAKATEIPCSKGTMFSVVFAPSDPDWPFDVENVVLEVIFPQDYPKKMFDVGLSQEQQLPMELISFVNQGIQKWVKQQQQARDKKDTVELPFRPFLRWLDRNLEKLFIEAAKQMKEQEEDVDDDLSEDNYGQSYKEGSATTSDRKIDSNLHGYASTYSQQSENYYCGSNSSVTRDHSAATTFENIDTNPETYPNRRQQERKYYNHGNDSNTERKDILLSDFMTFKNQSTKSKATHSKTSNQSDSTGKSTKDNVVFVNKNPVIEPSKGFVDSETIDDDDDRDFAELPSLEDIPIDIIPENSKPRGTEIRFKGLELCENTSTLRTETVTLTVECAKCKTRADMKIDKTRPSSMRCEKCTTILGVALRPTMIHQHSMPTLGYLDLQGCHPFDLVIAESFLIAGCLPCNNETSIKGPQYGTNQIWCSKCHQKLQIKIESTRFLQLQPTSSIVGDSNIPMPKRKPKPPGLREGFPLPEKGACKHYKKSFRWLRFPCCGKCYPCDVCHDEQECHEMKYASRMVCGFCSKEQPFSQGPCTACNSSTTKAKTSHWEGGRGCRNKTMMSRGDDRKFKNTNKTVSRKSQGKATPGKTKTK